MQGNAFGPYQLIDRLTSQEHRRFQHPVLEVWHAADTVQDRAVALRLMSVELLEDEYFNQWFGHHVDAAKQLAGPHFVEVQNHGQIDGRLFVDTQWITGSDVKTMLQAGPLDPGVALPILHECRKAWTRSTRADCFTTTSSHPHSG